MATGTGELSLPVVHQKGSSRFGRHGCYVDNVDINLFELSPIVNSEYGTRASNQVYFTFQHNVVNKLVFKYFYSQRIVTIWNRLPGYVKSVIVDEDSSKYLVKKSLQNFYVERLNANFIVDNTCSWTTFCFCTRCRPT